MGCGPSKEEEEKKQQEEGQEEAAPVKEKKPPPPPHTTEELQAMFKLYDSDKSNFIEMAELPMVLRSLDFPVTDTRCKEIMAKYDANGDGKLSFDEFVKLVNEEELPEREDDDDRVADAKEMFKLFDKDGSGFITLDELKAALMKGDPSHPDGGMAEEDVVEMFEGYDDGDGKLTIKEFIEMMVHGYEHAEEEEEEADAAALGEGTSAPPDTNPLKDAEDKDTSIKVEDA